MMRSACIVFGFLLLSATAAAQQYVISTYAGGAPPLLTPTPGVDVPIGSPLGVAADAAGNIYFASSLISVFKLDTNGVLTRVAGNSRAGYSGDGGPATSARLQLSLANSAGAGGVAVDGAGNLFITDTGNHCIRRVSPDGIIVTVAGNGTKGFSGDGGPAINSQLRWPTGVAVDGAGNLFIADTFNNRIRKVSPAGIITTAAGDGSYGVGGDGGPATSAQLNYATAVAVDSAGNLFIAEFNNGRIRKVSPSGIIATVASGLPALAGVAVDRAGNLFAADQRGVILQVSPSGVITTVAGNPRDQAFSGDGGPAISATLLGPAGVAVDGAGNLFIADAGNYRIRQVSPSAIIKTVAGNGAGGSSSSATGDGGPATSVQLRYPSSVAADSGGNVFIADTSNNRIRRVSPNGIITTVAGNGTRGFSGDGGPAINAQLNGPSGLALDGAGNLFFGDAGTRVRKVSASGIITTVAGNGIPGFPRGLPIVDGGPATSTALSGFVRYVAVDEALLIADEVHRRIRKVSPAGIITTVAGSGAFSGPSGDGGPATNARLSAPTGLALDRAGNLFIVDPGSDFVTGGETGLESCCDYQIRKVSADGMITTVAGIGTPGFSGDGGPASTAALNGPLGVAVDGAGSVYVADAANNAVRILRPTNQNVLIGAVVDAASQHADPVSPGKIVVIDGAGLGPSELIWNQPRNGQFGTELAGTTVSFSGTAAPVFYTSATQVAVVVPYAITGTMAQVIVAYQGETSAAFTVPVAASAPGLFTLNQAGWGQAAAINTVDGTLNTAANPVTIGGYIWLYATGEGQTTPGGLDGRIAGSSSARPALTVSVTVGGIPATVQYAGSAPGQVAGLMQANVQIPSGVQPGGYVPVVLQVGERSSSPAVWIAVEGN